MSSCIETTNRKDWNKGCNVDIAFGIKITEGKQLFFNWKQLEDVEMSLFDGYLVVDPFGAEETEAILKLDYIYKIKYR